MERPLVTPIAPARHPQGAWLDQPLRRALQASVVSVGPFVAPMLEPKTFDWLREWRPRGTVGWQAGEASADFNTLRNAVLIAATYTYSDRFSFLTSIPVMTEDDVHRVAQRRAELDTSGDADLRGDLRVVFKPVDQQDEETRS